MDCKKDEAIKVMTIAENKMESKDFTGARELVRKAQRLCPDMENILQMLTVCDVHCAAEKKLFGNEKDWYGILQIEQTANEATIKKQYRKHALILHPDKNNFVGAEAAFMLIGEAQRVLLDQDKRRLHDMKCQPAVLYRPPQRAGRTFNIGVQTNFRCNLSSFNHQHQQPQQRKQSGFVHGHATFWTFCPFCLMKFWYLKEMVNRPLCCQNCNKPFVAHNLEVQGAQFATNLKQTSFFQQQNSFNQVGHRVKVVGQGNFQSEKPRTGFCPNTQNSFEDPSEKFSGKKRRQTSESSESCESGSNSGFEETVVTDENGDNHSRKDVEHRPRRSSRNRWNVSYKEISSNDDEDFVTPEISKRNRSKETKKVSHNERPNKDDFDRDSPMIPPFRFMYVRRRKRG